MAAIFPVQVYLFCLTAVIFLALSREFVNTSSHKIAHFCLSGLVLP